MSSGPLPGSTVNSVITLVLVLMRPIRSALNSVNQRLPSAPVVMFVGPLAGVGIGNSIAVMAGTHRSSSCWSVGRNVLRRDVAAGRRRPKSRRTERKNRFMWPLKMKE